jgi:phosphohistidine phosphatase
MTKINLFHLFIFHSKGEQELIELIQSLPKELETVMIFGHNPTMSETVRQLTRMTSYFDMPTCAMVCMENSMNDWSVFGLMGTRLRWMLIPRLLRKEGE